MQRVDGKNVLITGAGSGFGRRTAELFASEGANNIYLVDRLQDRLDATAKVVKELGAKPVTICADLADMKQCADVIAQALSIDKKLDVLISNAAAWADCHFLDITDESWRHVLAVDLDAYFVLAQRAAMAMKETGGGVILFTASISALGHGRGFTAYTVAKTAVVALAKAIAVECAPFNIRANCVSPGPADTQQSVDLAGKELMDKWRTNGFPAVPLNRLASADDIANTFLFLASDEARYVSGANFVVDGGLSAQIYDVPKN